MDSLTETLPAALPLITIFLAPVIVLFILLNKIKRHGFYVNANCWFCNSWTKVLHKNRNSFDCPSCLQYNGFNEDGGYNKIIDAQCNTPNYTYKNTTRKTEISSNGFCTSCNHKQQLKIQQLANFVPLNEDNYDVEVEHFQKMLQKSYKLCKSCDKVLKTKIVQQAWILGNKIKYSRSNFSVNHSSLGLTKEISQSFSLTFIRYTLILFLLILLSLTMEVIIDRHMHNIQKYVPDTFLSYRTLFYDFYRLLRSASNNIINANQVYEFLPNNGKFNINCLVLLSFAGFFLELILLIWDRRSVWWKLNETVGWLILGITFLVPFNKIRFIYFLQVFCEFAVMSSLITTIKFGNKRSPLKRKVEFKKLKNNIESRDSPDEESTEEYLDFSLPSKKLNSNASIKGNEAGNFQSVRALFQNIWTPNYAENTASLNDSFTTARTSKTASVCNSSFKDNTSSSCELHHILDKVHLSNLNLIPQRCIPPVMLPNSKESPNSINRPLLSPPKLKNITQNSWAAGGFWKNDVNVTSASSNFTHPSRSSSQSSGFSSNFEPVTSNYFHSITPSRDPSICGDFERSSILSQPPYHFKPINSNTFSTNQTKNSFMVNASQGPKPPLSPKSNQLYYKAENNNFYPIEQNNLLFFQGAIPPSNFQNDFHNLSLRGFNTTNAFPTPALFGQRPVTNGLFKNLPGLTPQYFGYNTPNC